MTKRRKLSRLNRAVVGLLATLAGSLTVVPAAWAGVNVIQVISSDQAQQHIGETTTVCGMVASGRYINTPGDERVYLNFDHPYPKQTLAVVIPGAARSRFKEPPETLFQGKTVCVTGPITEYRGKPQIEIEDPSQITIQGESPNTNEASGETPPSPPAPPPSEPPPNETSKPQPPAPATAVPSGIASADAQNHIGETTMVCGPVASARYFDSAPGKPTLLNFDRPYPNHTFTVVVPGSARGRFREGPESLFRGKTICVTGRITNYRGKAEIVVEDPSRIVIQD
jgi:DNA/RNA endonuclease YhcR with UshA esterase domain